VLCVSLLLLCKPFTPLKAGPKDWGAEVNGLKMRISLDDIGDSGSPTSAFRVQLLNSGFIEATFTGTSAEDFAIPGMPYWKGTVVSNQLRFEVPKQ
jgi:hypothetical protein